MDAVNRLRTQGTDSDVYKALQRAVLETELDGAWITSDGTIVGVSDPDQVK